MAENQIETREQTPTDSLPIYETPRVQIMSEREILNTFQITQAMATWWGGC
jgi:hypothetical protein